MERKGRVSAFFLILIAGLLLSFSTHASETKQIELSYANFFPPTHIQAQLGESWAKEIETRTNGQVKITYYPGGALLKGPQIYDGVKTGIADIGMSVFAYSRGVFPSMEAIDLPLAYPNGKGATAIINAFYETFMPEELSSVKVMYLHAHGPGLLHSKKPVHNLEDFKGLKVRSTGFNAKVVEALGGVPVAMGQGGTYEALQKGVVDATFSPMEVLKGWKQGEVIKSTTECFSVGYTAGFYIAMNLDKWNALPDDVKAVIEEVSKAWIPKHGQAWDDSDKAGREFTIGLGNEIIALSPEESVRWAKAAQPVIAEYVKMGEEKGFPANDYVRFLESMVRTLKYAQ